MASYALCRASRATGQAIESWAQAHPTHPAAGPILAAINEETWAHTCVSETERAAAIEAAAAAGYDAHAADRVAAAESEAAVVKAREYLRALGY